MKLPAPLWLTAFWIVLCAYCTCIGWGLSAIHQLNATGYFLALLVGAIALVLFLRSASVPMIPYRWAKFRWRARHGLPAVYFLLTGLALVGGILYAPNNYDALTYRVPRILHWLAEGQWHWISSPNDRMNFSGTGFEWLMTPLLVFTKSDRLFFLITLISQLLLPGTIYTGFVRLGVSKRVAWIWMWLLPCGYCFVLQAGSIGNDTLAVPFLFAALALLLLARQSGQVSHFWLGMIAAGLVTGTKVSNAPLWLPCAVAALPAIRWVACRKIATLVVALIVVGVSFIPTAILNKKYTGDWSGIPGNEHSMKVDSPLYGLLGNGLQLGIGNLAPPIMPYTKNWNEQVAKLRARKPFPELLKHFPRLNLTCGELAQEEAAGIGFGLTLFLIFTGLALVFQRNARPAPNAEPLPILGWLVALSGVIALTIYMAKIGSESGPRLVAAYYPLVVLVFLLPKGSARLVRRRSYRIGALLAACTAVPAAILAPSRPLWPSKTVTEFLLHRSPNNALVRRASVVYEVYRSRPNGLASLRKYLSPEALKIGLVAADDPQVALWRPFGARRIYDLDTSTEKNVFEVQHVRLFIANVDAFAITFGCPIKEWVAKHRARVIGREMLLTKIQRGPQEWVVVSM